MRRLALGFRYNPFEALDERSVHFDPVVAAMHDSAQLFDIAAEKFFQYVQLFADAALAVGTSARALPSRNHHHHSWGGTVS